MRVQSYLTVVGLICTVGGLLLSGFLFERQLTIDSKTLEMEKAAQFRGDTLRFSDQVKQLLVTTDLLFGSQETYVLQASKTQTLAALAMCADIFAQLDESQIALKNRLGLVHGELEALLAQIETLETQATDAEFTVGAGQLNLVDEATYRLVEHVQHLQQVATRHVADKLVQHSDIRSELDLLVWVLSGLYLGVVIFTLIWAAKSVSRPLVSLSSSAEEALSDMNAFEPVLGGPYEVQRLTQHIGAFVTSLKEKIRDAERMSSELEYQATHDALTGLANRRNLEHVLRRADQTRYALCMIDLDQFKLVNDTSGHAAGDALLVQVSKILVKEVRADDTVVRMGGDEFALLLRSCSAERAVVIAERIREKIEALVFHWEATTHRIGCCIGIVCASEGHSDVSEIMRNADAACYAAKQAGRNRVMLHDSSLEEKERGRGDLHWVHLINRALDSGEFLLFSQVIQPLARNDQAGEIHEVLLRLRDRQARALVAPAAFMSAAERYGLITKIDRWVTSTVLKMAVAYREMFDERRSYWINLSGASLCDDAFTSHLAKSIRAAGVPEGSINFEITETAVIRNLAQASEFMKTLRALGCRFALDDFGSGLSSFGYLKSLPVDLIKIDGMFVRGILDDPIDRKFVQAIIEIAHTMNIQTVVEYVENAAVLEEVTALGADYAQGFGISKPEQLLPGVWQEGRARGAV